MSWTIAFLASFCVLVVCAFVFLLTVYIMEYRREEKAINDYVKFKGSYEKDLETLANSLYVVPLVPTKAAAPKKKEPTPVATQPKNKKLIN